MGEESGKAIREDSALRYGAWVRGQMQARGWDNATLARYAGLKKQTVGQILRGDALQPTAWQVAGIARAFGVDPNEVFVAAGLWESGQEFSAPVPRELARVYGDLGFPARRVVMRVTNALRDMEGEYARMTRPPLRQVAEAGEGTEDWRTQAELPLVDTSRPFDPDEIPMEPTAAHPEQAPPVQDWTKPDDDPGE